MPIVKSCARCGGPFSPRSSRHRWCDTCAPTSADRSPTTRTRPSSSTERQRIRLAVLERDPTCQLRVDEGCTVESTVADHIVPAEDGGRYELDNLRGSCHHCNSVRGGRRPMLPSGPLDVPSALRHGHADPPRADPSFGTGRPARITGPTRLA